ncbi:S8 family serine peptidase [Marininema halotolerans]|uniref:Minor extracellular serine protease Vpr n=1 Tax=Marininema halotolerans TaxID=1155944 RepID=A0A1I6Q3X5_9BACL|nr:S8 family serine peptidase [Marininema halotolerans]SFS47122.1 minor extracellular serine protease Vpr [Marininema halotolerans]
MKKNWWFSLILLVCMVALSSFTSPVQAWDPNTDAEEKSDGKSGYYFVELKNEPVADYKGDIKGLKATRVAKGEQLNAQEPNVKAYEKYLSNKRGQYNNWLKTKAGKAKVVENYSLTLNGVAVKANGVNPAVLKQGPGVKRVVKSIQYRPAMNASHGIINDRPMWTMGYKGAGVKVAVIDSGIDQDHPFLTDDSLKMPEGFPKVGKDEWKAFTSNKVIAARVFSPDANATPKAIGSHGTHVSGTIAGKSGYKDPSGAAKSRLSGVAPKAYLGNYNVFPCNGCSAESIYIAAAIEAAVKDGMDIANMSLGGPAEPGFDLLTEIVNDASDAGMTMVLSAGNSGPGPMTIGSPGTAEKAITVAAVANGHFIGQSIQILQGGKEQSVAVANASPGGAVTKEIKGERVIVEDGDGKACSGIAGDLTGKIAVIKRGDCTFTIKAFNAQEKGAAGVIITNNVTGDPSGMTIEEKVTIPAVMVSQEDGNMIRQGEDVSVKMAPDALQDFKSENAKTLASFSSRGPTVNNTLKPDVAGVGVNVYSSVVGGGLASYNGTSMAAPHVAGAAALLKEARPNWKPEDIKAALMGTGRNIKGGETKPLEVGGGIINVFKALYTPAMAYPSSLSFGLVDKEKEKTMKITLKNTTKTEQTYQIRVNKHLAKLSTTSLHLAKGKKGTIKVTIAPTAEEAGNDLQGYIHVRTEEGNKIRIPLHYRVQ